MSQPNRSGSGNGSSRGGTARRPSCDDNSLRQLRCQASARPGTMLNRVCRAPPRIVGQDADPPCRAPCKTSAPIDCPTPINTANASPTTYDLRPPPCYHETFMPSVLDRRTLLRLMPVLAATAALPEIDAQNPAPQQPQRPAPPPQVVTKEMLHNALSSIGIELTEAQETMALPGVNRNYN